MEPGGSMPHSQGLTNNPYKDVAHSLPLGGADRGFLFTEDETQRRFSYLSGAFRERFKGKDLKKEILHLLKINFTFV